MNGLLIAASTTRGPTQALGIGGSGGYTTRLAVVYVQSVAGKVLRPMSPKLAADVFGVQLELPARVRALWPAGNIETFPVQPKDMLILPASEYATGGEYFVEAVKPYPGRHLDLLVQVSIS